MSQPPQKKTVMSALDQLKKHTVVVADSGDIKGKCVFYLLVRNVPLLRSGWGNKYLDILISGQS